MNETPALKPSALVIDDELQIRRLLRASLEGNGYRVLEAATGQDASPRRPTPPDVILLDLGLPDMDGVDVLKRLREWSAVPVLVLSVRDREEDKVARSTTAPMIMSPNLSARLNCLRGCAPPNATAFRRPKARSSTPAI